MDTRSQPPSRRSDLIPPTRIGGQSDQSGASAWLTGVAGKLQRSAARLEAPRRTAGWRMRQAWWRYARVPDALLLPTLYRLTRAVERGAGGSPEYGGHRKKALAAPGASPGGHLVLWLALTTALVLAGAGDIWILNKVLPGFAGDVLSSYVGISVPGSQLPTAPVLLVVIAAALGFLTAALDRYNDDSALIGLLRLMPLLVLVSIMAVHGGAIALWISDHGILDALNLPAHGPLRPAVGYGAPALGAMLPALVMAFAYGAWRAFVGFISDVPAGLAAPRIETLEPHERELLEALRTTLAARGVASVPVYRRTFESASFPSSLTAFRSSATAPRPGTPGEGLATGSGARARPAWPILPWSQAVPQLVTQLLLGALGVGTLLIVAATLSGSLAARTTGSGLIHLVPWGVALATYLATFMAAEARWSSESAVLAALGLREARGRAILGGLALLLATVGWATFAWATLALRPLGPSLGLALATILLVVLAGVLSAARFDRSLAAAICFATCAVALVAWVGLAAAALLVSAAAGLFLLARALVRAVDGEPDVQLHLGARPEPAAASDIPARPVGLGPAAPGPDGDAADSELAGGAGAGRPDGSAAGGAGPDGAAGRPANPPGAAAAPETRPDPPPETHARAGRPPFGDR